MRSNWGPSSDAIGNEHAALQFAKSYGSRDCVDMKRLQRIIIESKNADCCYQFARDVPGANIRRLEYVVARYGELQTIRAFILNVPRANKRFLEGVITVKEVLFI
jgi:hypothetical protein